MTEIFIVNLAGSASPTEIKQLAKETAAYGGQWVSSQIHYMDSQVSALIKVQSASTQSELIQQLFKKNKNLHTIITPCELPYHDSDESYLIVLKCIDRPGLIRDINHKLEQQNAKVLSFS
ncbi:MAG: ACT domain-containing protein, partial [Vibrio sp.]